jgi:hypothetical protein
MLLLFKRCTLILLLALLVGWIVVRGVVPALTTIDSDFPNYFTAAKIVAEHGDVSRLYDDAWFQEQESRYHVGSVFLGKFSPFPPPSALLMLPLTGMRPLQALRAMTVLTLLCVTGAGVLLARSLRWEVLEALLFVLLSGLAVVSTLRLGQPYILISACCILGYYARDKGWPVLAGICFGLFVPVKYFPVIFLLYFAYRREWRLVAAGGLSAAMLTLLSVVFLGWELHRQFLAQVLVDHLMGKLGTQDPFAVSFQSFDSLFRRLFVPDAQYNPHPAYAAPWLHSGVLIVTKAAILAATFITLRKVNQRRSDGAVAASLGILGVATLLLAPATATYHIVLLWLPIALLVQYCVDRDMRFSAAALVLIYVAIGFSPYRFVARFDSSGFLTVLAYPRLLLLCGVFLVALHALRTPARS